MGTPRPPLRDFGGYCLAAATASGFVLRAPGAQLLCPGLENFVVELLEHFPHGIILVLDRWSVHRSAAKQLHQRFPRRIRIEWLPSHAPELNPDEQIWTQTKYRDLANFCPDNLTELRQAVRHSLEHTKSHLSLLRSFFEHAGLTL